MTAPNDPASDPGAATARDPSAPGPEAPGHGAGHAEHDAPPAAAAPVAPAPPEDDFAALFAASEAEHPSQARAKTGDTVEGNVIAVGPDNAFVAIGGKAEAVIS